MLAGGGAWVRHDGGADVPNHHLCGHYLLLYQEGPVPAHHPGGPATARQAEARVQEGEDPQGSGPGQRRGEYREPAGRGDRAEGVRPLGNGHGVQPEEHHHQGPAGADGAEDPGGDHRADPKPEGRDYREGAGCAGTEVRGREFPEDIQKYHSGQRFGVLRPGGVGAERSQQDHPPDEGVLLPPLLLLGAGQQRECQRHDPAQTPQGDRLLQGERGGDRQD